MLSEAEQRRLFQIESSLRAEDPGFARRFEARAGRGSGRTWRLVVALLAVALAVIGVVVGLALGSTVLVVVAVTVLGAGLGLLITRRHTR